MSDPTLTKNGLKFTRVLPVVLTALLAAGGGWWAGRRSAEPAPAVSAKPEPEAAPAPVPVAGAQCPPAAKPEVPAAVPVAVAPAVAPAPEPAPAGEPAVSAPAVLRVITVPMAEVTVQDAAGARLSGRADAAGEFRAEALPAGEFRVEVRHPAYLPMEAPVPLSLRAGETVERVVVPPSAPATLVVFADVGAQVYVDGKPAGRSGSVILSKMPSRRTLLVALGAPGSDARFERVRLEPKEIRTVDLRSPEVASAPTPAAGESAAAAKSEASLAVRVVSSDVSGGVIALSQAKGGAAPLEAGRSARWRAAGATTETEVKCVRVFAGVSVCRGELTPADAAATAGELRP